MLPNTDSEHLFDDFLVVGLSSIDDEGVSSQLITSPKGPHGRLVVQKLYHLQNEHDTSHLIEFCFPEQDDLTSPSESFIFTLTKDDSTRVFGFCRRLVPVAATNGGIWRLPICLCVLSQRPWFSLYTRVLDIVEKNYDPVRFVPSFVRAAYEAQMPSPRWRETIRVEPLVGGRSFYGSFELSPPDEESRPTGVQFGTLLESLGAPNTLRVLAALMTEQKVVFVGSRWGHVSGCAHAASELLYPLQWQHIFVPVLPKSKLSYACAPMPFVLGIAQRNLAALQQEPIDNLLFVDVDNGRLWGDAEVMEAAVMPSPYREYLHERLSRLLRAKVTQKATWAGRGDAAVAEAVVMCMARLLGPYRKFVAPRAAAASQEEHPIHDDFDEAGFVADAPPSAQGFLRAMRTAQLFEVWRCRVQPFTLAPRSEMMNFPGLAVLYLITTTELKHTRKLSLWPGLRPPPHRDERGGARILCLRAARRRPTQGGPTFHAGGRW